MERTDGTRLRRDLLVASNRLPVTLSRSRSGIAYKPSVGGLATALSGVRSDNFLWVGWPGTDLQSRERAQVREELLREHRCMPVFLTSTQTEQFYNRFSNGVLWPLFHYLPEFTDFDLEGWTHYQEVNELFAEVIAPLVQPDTTVWVHDYHLMLLPRMLRERMPEARIGFFLHIPFPSSEVYRLLPVRREILRGLLGADVVGFHTYDYARHFRSACMRILGCDSIPRYVDLEGRRVRLSVNPIGIDVDYYRNLAGDPNTVRELAKLRTEFEGRKVILGVDRMDYSKGLRHKLRAFQRFLERNPAWRTQTVLLQVAVPSRTDVRRYRQLRREIEELVGHVNGLHGSVGHAPVHFLFKTVPPHMLSALYQLADVCWVSPIRDGMNLVCQEFVASKKDGDGVLVLSEFAGAASALEGAIRVNPWNLDQMAESLREGLEMPAEQALHRMQQMQTAIAANRSSDWAHKFISLVRPHTIGPDDLPVRRRVFHHLDTLLESFARAPRRFLLLDYDGTLCPFAPTPEEARPTPELLELLQMLPGQPNTEVFVVSGRTPDTLEEWLGHLPIALCAEHGQVLRLPGSDQWKELVATQCDWMETVLPIMNNYAAVTPGAVVERKRTGLAWHYRRCDPEFGQWQANELAFHLSGMLSNQPAEVIHGHKVIEVRVQGLNKGALVRYLIPRIEPGDFVFAVGDDRTDEDLFAQLPPGAWSVRVGKQPTQAIYFVDKQSDVLILLRRLAECMQTTEVSSHI